MNEFGTFKDERDGYVYKTVTIGEQTWFAENFRYDCAGSKVYENKTKNLKRYGRLYTWQSAMNAAPEGWKLPGQKEWEEMIRNVGGGKISGKVLKSNEGWNDDGNGTDEFGFCALPGGHCTLHGNFNEAGECGNWWNSINYNDDDPYYWNMGCNHDRLSRHYFYLKFHLFSVRYVRL